MTLPFKTIAAMRICIVRPVAVSRALDLPPAWRRAFPIVLTLALLLASLCFRAAQAERRPAPRSAAALARYRYIAATGHNIGPRVGALYDRGGGLPIFGMPLTEEIEEQGLRVQYFERARFELRPDGETALTPLGALLSRNRSDPAFARPAMPSWIANGLGPAGGQALGAAWGRSAPFEIDSISGHTVGEVFGAFWRAHGGAELLGRPISEEFGEINPHDGRSYLVQYFERARLERHPEFAGAEGEVMLGLLGREFADTRGVDPALRAPAQPIVVLGAATLGFSATPARQQNIALAASRLDGQVVAVDQEHSFLAAVGEITRAAGFAPDDAIVGGELTKEVGGSICYVSTALYRAAYRAGLPISERHAHSLPLDRSAGMLGFDAAVYSPGLDLRWRNDTPSPIEVAASVDAAGGSITIALWGAGDRRSVTLRGPLIANRRPPAPDTWRFDAALRAGASRQIAKTLEGMDIVFRRTVLAADGRLLRQDSFTTHYQPRGALYLYGRGVIPP